MGGPFPRAPFGRPFGFAQGRLWATARSPTSRAAKPTHRLPECVSLLLQKPIATAGGKQAEELAGVRDPPLDRRRSHAPRQAFALRHPSWRGQTQLSPLLWGGVLRDGAEGGQAVDRVAAPIGAALRADEADVASRHGREAQHVGIALGARPAIPPLRQ